MGEDRENNSGKVKGVIEAVTELAKAVPVYQDAIQPAAKQAGKALETVGKVVNTALMPIRGLVWGADQFEEFVKIKLAGKLKETPEDDIVTPPPYIAGPALEALRFTGEEGELQNLYANLLANAMDAKSDSPVHPSYVEIIKQMKPIEAAILKEFSSVKSIPYVALRIQRLVDGKKQDGWIEIEGFVSSLAAKHNIKSHKEASVYINNLMRLGLLDSPMGSYLTKKNVYDPIIDMAEVKEFLKQSESSEFSHSYDKRFIKLTPLGEAFLTTCVVDYKKSNPATN